VEGNARSYFSGDFIHVGEVKGIKGFKKLVI
jgi:hypothetical protein